MHRVILAAAVLAATATAASAQPRPPTAILYAQPNFQGQSFTVNAFQANLNGSFNDVAQSARFPGRWRICVDANFRSKCQDVSGDYADLGTVGMKTAISSLQAYVPGFQAQGPMWGSGGGGRGGGGWRGQPMEGANHVLFAYPSVYGMDIAATSGSDDAFCKAMGFSSWSGADYADTSQSAPTAIDGQGRYWGQTNVLRDVLCRK